jgi:hypothetical protein
MSDGPSNNLGGLEIELAREIDVICRRFEADWRDGRSPAIDDYLGQVSTEGRAALRAELEAVQRELRTSEETDADPGVREGRPQSTFTEAPAGAPLIGSDPNQALTSVHEQATVAPRDDITTDLGSSVGGTGSLLIVLVSWAI